MRRRGAGPAVAVPLRMPPPTSFFGRVTSTRRPATSTTTLVRAAGPLVSASSPDHGSSWLSYSVSIQRVYTENGSSPSGANAGLRTMSRWNGSTVGSPATSNSSRARRARSRASLREEPVTMSLASSESNAPEISSPVVTPESTRTPGPPGKRSTCTGPGEGRKLRPGSSPLMRNSMECPLRDGVGVVERAALGEAELLAHEVDAGDLLGDGVLDLQAGVHLEERDGAVLADEELAGAGADVADLLEDRLRRLVERAVLLLGEERRGRLLDELLVAALQRAVAGRHDHDVAVLVGEALGLDVAGLVEVLLDEALAAAERRDRLAGGRLEELGHLLARAGDLEAAAAAAEGGLDRHGQAVHVDELEHLRGIRHRVQRAGGERRAHLLGDVRAPTPCRRGARWPRARGRSR